MTCIALKAAHGHVNKVMWFSLSTFLFHNGSVTLTVVHEWQGWDSKTVIVEVAEMMLHYVVMFQSNALIKKKNSCHLRYRWSVRAGLGSSRCGHNLGGVLVAAGGGGARTPSEHLRGTLEKGTEAPNAHMGPWISWRLIQACTIPLLLCSWDRLKHHLTVLVHHSGTVPG